MVTGIYQEVELSLTENLIPVTVPVKQYDNKARKVRCVLYNNSVEFYDVSKHDFVNETYKKARYYWNNGNVLRIEWNGSELVKTEFAYIHLQMRKIRVKVSVQDACFEILPDRFVEQELPKNRSELHLLTIGWPYLYWIDNYKKRVIRKWKQIVRKTI